MIEAILNNGFFWGILMIAFAAIAGYFGLRPENKDKKQTFV